MGCGEERAARSLRQSAAQLAAPHFLPAPTCRNITTGESADGQKRTGAGGRFSHELYMVSHFKQQPLSTHNNTRLCYSWSYRYRELARELDGEGG